MMLRSLKKVDGEWHQIGTTHNLLKLFRYRRSQQLVGFHWPPGGGTWALLYPSNR